MKLLVSALIVLGVAFPAFALEKKVVVEPGEHVIIHVKPTAEEALKAKYDADAKKLADKKKASEKDIKVVAPNANSDDAKDSKEPAKTDDSEDK